MPKKIILIVTAFFCVTISNVPALAVYSGITDTVENVIQVLAKENDRSVMSQMKKYSPSNVQEQNKSNMDDTVSQQEIISTGSNADEQVQTYTNSDAEKLS